MLTALGVRGENYYGQLLARQIDWLTTLINSRDKRFTYFLRVISSPDPEPYTRGRLTIALLCRIDECTVLEGEDIAAELSATVKAIAFSMPHD